MEEDFRAQLEKQYHIACGRGDVGRYVLLPGDPGRVPLIAAYLDDAKKEAEHREYTTYTGYVNGEKVSVTSTGIGGPSTAIAVEELAYIGADTFIRVGTSGPMQEFMEVGDLVVVTAAVRDEGTSQQYMPLAFPAVADLDVAVALREACRARGVRHHVGVCHSKDSFYGELQPWRMPVKSNLEARWQAWIQGGVLCSEMEAATLFVVSNILGLRAGGLMLAIDTMPSLDTLCSTAVKGIRLLIELDRQAGRLRTES
jgi:uridine phosphorylase